MKMADIASPSRRASTELAAIRAPPGGQGPGPNPGARGEGIKHATSRGPRRLSYRVRDAS